MGPSRQHRHRYPQHHPQRKYNKLQNRRQQHYHDNSSKIVIFSPFDNLRDFELRKSGENKQKVTYTSFRRGYDFINNLLKSATKDKEKEIIYNKIKEIDQKYKIVMEYMDITQNNYDCNVKILNIIQKCLSLKKTNGVPTATPSTSQEQPPRQSTKPHLAESTEQQETADVAESTEQQETADAAEYHPLNDETLEKIIDTFKEYIEVSKKYNDKISLLYSQSTPTHKNLTTFSCLTCFKKFENRDALKEHTLSHGIYPCAFCGEKFNEKCKLKMHLYIHRN